MTKTCIENCLILTSSKAAKIPRLHFGTITWGKRNNICGSISIFRVNDLEIKLEYQIDGKSICYDVGLNTTPLPWDKLRYWFTCSVCGRRVAHLYKPRNHIYFLCRHCHNLTYHSRQVNNRWSRMIKAIDRL